MSPMGVYVFSFRPTELKFYFRTIGKRLSTIRKIEKGHKWPEVLEIFHSDISKSRLFRLHRLNDVDVTGLARLRTLYTLSVVILIFYCNARIES